MKNLIVYYSLEGNSKSIAEIIEKELECDVMELKPKKEYSKGRFSKFLSGGKGIFTKEKPELINTHKDLSGYDNIVIGSPVWCGTYAPPISTFISKYKNDMDGKNIAVFACHGGGGADKLFNNLKKELNNNKFIGNIDFKEPLKRDKVEVKVEIKKWISSLNIK